MSSRTAWGLIIAVLLFLVVGLTPWKVVGSDPGLPKVGSRLPSVVQGARMRNAPVDVKAPQGGWVVYVFSPNSAECETNAASVEQLARSLSPGWVLLAVATEAQGVPAFLERLHVTVPVLTQVPEKVLAQYRITGTPRTYVLDKDWGLLEVLDGPFQGKVARRLAARFQVTLKTLADPAPAQAADATARGSQGRPPGLCLDRQQYKYSRGAKADVLGLKLQCGSGGVWVPAT